MNCVAGTIAVVVALSVPWYRTPAAADPQPAERIAYGPAPSQFAELWLPAAAGPAPVVILVHGGCWQSRYGLDLMHPLAADLAAQGIAVWNIEYRRLGEAGGGYPGTFADVAQAVDALREAGRRHPLDLGRVVAVGHSAGGHLALWAAARRRLPAGSALAGGNPLPIGGVMTLAGIDDLAAYAANGPACGGAATIDALVGGGARPPAQRYLDTSPRALLPLGVPQTVVSGSRDGTVPPQFGRDYAAAAKAAGDRVEAVVIDGADHFALIDPGSPAWRQLRPRLFERLR